MVKISKAGWISKQIYAQGPPSAPARNKTRLLNMYCPSVSVGQPTGTYWHREPCLKVAGMRFYIVFMWSLYVIIWSLLHCLYYMVFICFSNDLI